MLALVPGHEGGGEDKGQTTIRVTAMSRGSKHNQGEGENTDEHHQMNRDTDGRRDTRCASARGSRSLATAPGGLRAGAATCPRSCHAPACNSITLSGF